MDLASLEYIRKLDDSSIQFYSLQTLENYYPELLIAKSNRSLVEFYFTCTATICSYVFINNVPISLLTYLDADLCFYSSAEPIYQELENSSIGIISHKYFGLGKIYEKYGKYNVGWVSFRNDKEGRDCLEEWRKNCTLWCYDKLENGLFADQKYLDYWYSKYKGLKVIQNVGANLAIWNIGQYKMTIRNRNIFVNDSPLIFYHFASLKKLGNNLYVTNLYKYFTFLSTFIKNNIYLPYLLNLENNYSQLGIKLSLKERKAPKRSIGSMLKRSINLIRQYFFSDFIITK